jgi:nitrite reductase/ring-hydroxylating ferredoxin subunit
MSHAAIVSCELDIAVPEREEDESMLAREENELITRVSSGTPMGDTMRRYWMPALLAWELPEPDCAPVRVKLLGEDLVAFRDTSGRIGLLDEYCPHRRVSLFFGRNEECGLRCVYHGWKFDVAGRCVDMMNEPEELQFKNKIRSTSYPTVEVGGIIGPTGTTGPATTSAQFCLDIGARDASPRHQDHSKYNWLRP